MNKLCCLLLATILSSAYAADYEIIGVKILNPLSDRLSQDEIKAYNDFMDKHEYRQRSLRSRVYNCCRLCHGWPNPQCGIYMTNGYCDVQRMSKCGQEDDFDMNGYRNLQEEDTTAVAEVTSGLNCEMAKRTAMEALVNALEGRDESSLESILEGIVLTCYGIPAEQEVISSFSLWDANTDTLVSDKMGDTIQLCRGFRFNVEAVVSNREDVKKVEFVLQGNAGTIYSRVEYQWRYMLYGDRHNEVIYGDALMEPGEYLLRATPNGNRNLSKNIYIQVDDCDEKDD